MAQSGNRQQINDNIQYRRKKESAGTRNNADLKIVNVQRNPYLVEYDAHRKTGKKSDGAGDSLSRVQPQNRRIAETWEERGLQPQHRRTTQPQSRRTTRPTSQRTVGSQSCRTITQSSLRSADWTSRQGAGRRRISRQEKRRKEQQRRRVRLLLGCVCALVLCIFMYRTFFEKPQVDGSVPPQTAAADSQNALFGQRIQGLKASDYYKHPTWTEDFLTVNEYSRPGDALKRVNNIFVHYTANPNTSAAQNRSYFEQLKDTHERSASAHFIIGYEGEIVQCVPLDEIAYAVVGRNEDSISIECCYTAEDGSFTQETYDSLIALLKWLTDAYNLEEEDILRHYDCGGKKCPIYYVEHEDAWEQLKKDVGK